ncbi:hypothetical protein L7F22_048370 [Adiantum nelumboides]|nr:hypothetical protein [Adiantum nelumboides]
MKVLDHDSCEKKLLGHVRVMADSTYSAVRKEITQDGLVDGSFTFIIEEDDDGEACTLTSTQEERWQVENVKVIGIKRCSSTIMDGVEDESGPTKRQCQDLEEPMEARDLKESNEHGSPEFERNNMLKSALISKFTLQSWQTQCEKTRKNLKKKISPREDRFELSTKDLNGHPLVQIWCYECGTFYGSGCLGKQSAYSCLSNFMPTHVLESLGHQKRYLAH